MLLPIAFFLLVTWLWQAKVYSDVVYAAFVILSGIMSVATVLGMRQKYNPDYEIPKLLSDMTLSSQEGWERQHTCAWRLVRYTRLIRESYS